MPPCRVRRQSRQKRASGDGGEAKNGRSAFIAVLALNRMKERSMPGKLDAAAIAEALADLPDWRYDAEAAALRRGFGFPDFSAAFAFMVRVALLAEAAGHHPDWSNSYNKVEIALSTHSAGGVTDKDVALARGIDRLAA
jgi:4a-hydroxytetrahydrobiopterin dehydratase